MFSVRFRSTRVERELQRLPEQDRSRVMLRLNQLAQDARPQGIASLDASVYRLRVGQFRLIYEVDNDAQEITVLRIARRNARTYRGLEELF